MGFKFSNKQIGKLGKKTGKGLSKAGKATGKGLAKAGKATYKVAKKGVGEVGKVFTSPLIMIAVAGAGAIVLFAIVA